MKKNYGYGDFNWVPKGATERMVRQLLDLPEAKIVVVKPLTPTEDGALHLGGRYDGVHISIGPNYYSVVNIMPNGSMKFIPGHGDLRRELEIAMS